MLPNPKFKSYPSKLGGETRQKITFDCTVGSGYNFLAQKIGAKQQWSSIYLGILFTSGHSDSLRVAGLCRVKPRPPYTVKSLSPSRPPTWKLYPRWWMDSFELFSTCARPACPRDASFAQSSKKEIIYRNKMRWQFASTTTVPMMYLVHISQNRLLLRNCMCTYHSASSLTVECHPCFSANRKHGHDSHHHMDEDPTNHLLIDTRSTMMDVWMRTLTWLLDAGSAAFVDVYCKPAIQKTGH
jgi:hypothetical protein